MSPKQRLIDIYAQESNEALRKIQSHLLELERASLPSDERAAHVADTLSLLHGIKGGAMVIGELTGVAELLHDAESFLGGLPRDRALTGEEVDPLLSSVDACRRLIEAAVLGEAAPAELRTLADALRPDDAAGAEASPDLPLEPAPLAEAPESPANRAPTHGQAAEGVRVSVEELDTLTRSLRELRTSHAAAERQITDVEELGALIESSLRQGGDLSECLKDVRERLQQLEGRLQRDQHRLVRASRDAQETADRLRMLPFSSLFDLFRRAHRDLLRRTGKASTLTLEGGDVLMDKRALDDLKAPLLHLIRNSVDHGLEDPSQRRMAGKVPEGRVRLSARRRRGRIEIDIADDGRGVDIQAAREHAQAQGLDNAYTAPLLEVLALPGLSTRDTADEISGRGLGMGTVKDLADRLGGHLELESEIGVGTRFHLSLPPTLATRKGLLVEAAGQRFHIPAEAIQRIIRAKNDAIVAVDGSAAVQVGDQAEPILRLDLALGLSAQRNPQSHEEHLLVVVETGRQRAALEVDRVYDQVEIAVQPLRYPLVSVRLLGGMAVDSDGTAVPVLDVAALLRSDRDRSDFSPGQAEGLRRPRILIVDDSITTRTLERNVLEGAGMEVTVASDGLEALGLVTNANAFDLVVSDVEMPHLDGLGLVRELRAKFTKEDLPLVLVTSVDRDAVRLEGMQSGANAFILKQTFDPEQLLSVIYALLPDGLLITQGN